MPAACSHEQMASVARTPISRGPVARLKKKSVGIGDLDGVAAAIFGSVLLGVIKPIPRRLVRGISCLLSVSSSQLYCLLQFLVIFTTAGYVFLECHFLPLARKMEAFKLPLLR